MGIASDNSINLNGMQLNIDLPPLSSAGINRTESFVGRLIKSISPVRYAEKQNEAKMIELQGIHERACYCKTVMPWLTDKQAYLHSSGYMVSEDQAENTFSILSQADKLIEDDIREHGCDDDAQDDFPSDFIGQVMDSIRNVSDETMQSYWANLIRGQWRNPGSFSKHTIQILAYFGPEEARTFEKLCSMSAHEVLLGSNEEMQSVYDTIYEATARGTVHTDTKGLPVTTFLLIDKGGTTYNNGAISYNEISLLESLGLLRSAITKRKYVCGQGPIHILDGVTYAARNPGSSELQFKHDHFLFTKYGQELSRLCKIGNSESLPSLLVSELKRQGFEPVLPA